MSDPFIGEIIMFGGTFVPRNYADCNGQLELISQNNALFALLGTQYGGDGRTTFGLPELRGRVPIHQGQGPGLVNRRIGDRGGSETEVLNASTVPQHSHTLNASNSRATQKSPAGAVIADKTRGDMYFADFGDPPLSPVAMNSAAVGNTGAGDDHPNVQSSQVIRYCIALFGVFPSRA